MQVIHNIHGSAPFWHGEKLRDIMYTCIILHNIIVENERDTITNWDDDASESLFLVSPGCTQDFQQYRRRNTKLRDKKVHHQLWSDFVEHIQHHFGVNENENLCFLILY